MGAFTRHRRSGALIATFSGVEAELLRSLASQLVELLRHEAAVPDDRDPFEAMMDFSGPTHAPEDPVLARLFPSAYVDDDESAAEFRRFTETTLRDGKAAGAARVIDDLEEAGLPDEPDPDVVIDVELDEPAASMWLKSLNDLRLALAVRLGIEDEEDHARLAELPDDDPQAQAHGIFEWVGWVQDTLVAALEDRPDRPDGPGGLDA